MMADEHRVPMIQIYLRLALNCKNVFQAFLGVSQTRAGVDLFPIDVCSSSPHGAKDVSSKQSILEVDNYF